MQKTVCDHKIKCVALDLDRTTLRSDGTLSPRTKKALKDGINAGIEVVIVSGRAFDSLPEDILQISGIRYISTSNGASVYKLSGGERADGSGERLAVCGERIHGWTIRPEDVSVVLKVTKTYFERGQITYEMFVDGAAFAPAEYVADPVSFGLPQRAVAYTQKTRRPVADILEFAVEHRGEMESMDIILKDSALYSHIRQLIREQTREIYLTSSVEYRLEISHRDGGKASGLRYILDSLGLQPENTMAFGDGDNDADMLRFAGVGAAVENATPYCLGCADLVVGSNDSDGVAEMIERLL